MTLASLIFFLGGCTSMKVEGNKDGESKNVINATNYYMFWGVWPVVKMHGAEDFCGEQGLWQSTTLETTWLDAAITVVSAGLVIPQSMTVQCR